MTIIAPTLGWLLCLNELAGTTGLGENAAANYYAYGANHQNGLLKALNDKAGTTNLGLDAVCNVLAGTTGLSALDALNVAVGELVPFPLTVVSGVLGSNFNVSSASTTYTWLTTASLAVGTWLLTVNAVIYGTGNQIYDIGLATGTATATFAGPQGASVLNQYNLATMGSFTCIVTVTVAGTLVLQVQTNGADSAAVEATSSLLSRACSGYTATKIG